MDFRQWLTQFADAPTPIGDLARDIAEDRCMDADTEEGQREHLEGHGAADDALDVHAEAWTQYRQQNA